MEGERAAGGEPARDLVVVEGINARGFGTVPKAVMRDPSLPVEAKGIYSYLCSFAGGGNTAFPSRATMLAELGLSKDRFYKYRQMLIDAGLVRVEQRSAGNVAHPVRSNVYVLTATMPERYAGERRAAAPSPAPPEPGDANSAKAQVANGVRKTRTPSGGFPQSAGQERRPDFQDVVETRTVNCPGNKDTAKAGPPRSAPENSGTIKNRGRIGTKTPSIPPGWDLAGIEREFDELSSPERTPNRNRIGDALAPYARMRALFSAEVIARAWDRRQRPARELGRDAVFYPQLARWLEDPGHDGAERMCEAEAERAERRDRTRLAVALSLDEGYMAMRERAAALAEAAGDGGASERDGRELAMLRGSMSAIRERKAAEIGGEGAREGVSR